MVYDGTPEHSIIGRTKFEVFAEMAVKYLKERYGHVGDPLQANVKFCEVEETYLVRVSYEQYEHRMWDSCRAYLTGMTEATFGSQAPRCDLLWKSTNPQVHGDTTREQLDSRDLR